MDRVLALLDGGIYTSTTQQAFYTSSDKIKAEFLPWVQVFATVSETSTADYLEHPSTGTFRLEIIDASTNRETVRDALEALSVEMARDPSFGGLCQDITMGPRSVFESAENEHARGAADVSYSLFNISTAATGDVTDIDFVGRASDLALNFTLAQDATSPDQSGIGDDIINAIQIRVLAGHLTPYVEFAAPGFSDQMPFTFPADQQTINFHYYALWDAASKSPNCQIRIEDNAGGWSRWEQPMQLGWTNAVCVIDNPSSSGGSEFNRALPVVSIKLVFVNFEDAGWVGHSFSIYRIYHTAYQDGVAA